MAILLLYLKKTDCGKVKVLGDFRMDILDGNFRKLGLDSDISALLVRYLTCFECKNCY